MLRKVNLRATLITAAIAAALFSILVAIYIYHSTYTDTWLLYMGSFLFGIVMWIHTTHDNKTRRENESTVALVFSSHMATIAGVAISCLVSFLLLVIMVPGYLASGPPATKLSDAPANITHDKTEGLSFHVYFASTIINFSIGSFIGIILPFYSKRNQTKDSREPVPLQNKSPR